MDFDETHTQTSAWRRPVYEDEAISEPPTQIDITDSTGEAVSESGGSERADTCRICRSEGSTDEPLFFPCKCSGSIKYVHQECLMEWLAHSHKKHCELCKTPFRFTKLYDADMPNVLPWSVFIQRACIHALLAAVYLCRLVLVAVIWLVALPWFIRLAWRWLFWIADAGWAREAWMENVNTDRTNHSELLSNFQNSTTEVVSEPRMLAAVRGLADNLGLVSIAHALGASNSSNASATILHPDTAASLLSSWTYVSKLTSNAKWNRIILDIFEGQLITCVVIAGFVLVFLIREWVVQQQPVPNLENVEQHLRDAAEARQERLRIRQEEVANDPRHRWKKLLITTILVGIFAFDDFGADEGQMAMNRTELRKLLNEAVDGLRVEDDSTRLHFQVAANSAIDRIRAGMESQANKTILAAETMNVLVTFSDFALEQWVEAVKRKIDADQAEGRSLTQGIQTYFPASDDNDPNHDAEDKTNHAGPAIHESIDLPPVDVDTSPDSLLGTHQRGVALQSDQHNDSELYGPVDPVLGVSISAHSDIPITNAGPDAKVNVLCSAAARGRAIGEPISRSDTREIAQSNVDTEQLTQSRGGPQTEESSTQATNVDTFDDSLQIERGATQDDGEPVDDGDANRNIHSETQVNDHNLDPETPGPEDPAKNRSYVQSLADWLWADIDVESDEQGPTSPPEEERVFRIDHDEMQVPEGFEINHRAHGPDDGDEAENAHAADDVVAAAAQAGLDAEVMDEAEDLEGILELIGLQGPIIGLVQTSAFCTVLVIATVAAAVVLPYVWGKLVLSFIGSPVHLLVKGPLQLASFIADTVVDMALLTTSWCILVTAEATGLQSARWSSIMHGNKVLDWGIDAASRTVHSSANRLYSLLPPLEEVDTLAMNLPFLGASAHAHTSLLHLKDEFAAVLRFVTEAMGACAEFVSSSGEASSESAMFSSLSLFRNLGNWTSRGAIAFQGYLKDWISHVASLRSGALTFKTQTITLDPSLIYWSSTDRFLAVVAGYLALAALATFYVATDTYITRSPAGQKTEKIVRDSLRQAGGVLKVILIISIEMLVFPFYCGLLLDLAFLPIFDGASVAKRWTFAANKPYMFCFVHWFFGTCYMFHFALFVGMCRKILRKGVLWFIRDPDDPTFHPVRDVLERNVTTQLRKIAFSALVYGALVILCLGGVIWTVDHALPQMFPIQWVSAEPIWEFPVDLLLYNAMTPIIIRFLKPSDVVHQLYTWWLRHSARELRLSHFLFGDRQKDEETRSRHFALTQTRRGRLSENHSARNSLDESHVNAVRGEIASRHDGKFVLTPCSDQYRPPKRGEAILHADADEVFIVDRKGKRNEHFAAVYIPPRFRVRVTLFMVCLWAFSAFLGLCTTLLPLVTGRQILAFAFHQPRRVNDIYAYSLGIYFLGAGSLVVFGIKRLYQSLRDFAGPLGSSMDVRLRMLMSKVGQGIGRGLKCLYAYGFVGVVLPMMMAFSIQFYVILPLHTYAASFLAVGSDVAAAPNVPTTAVLNSTVGTPTGFGFIHTLGGRPQSEFAIRHTIHMLQDYCLGVLCIRVLIRGVNDEPMTKVVEAFRRVTAKGLTDPDVRLVTRYAVLPATAIACVALFGPIILARVLLTMIKMNSADSRTLVYRYSYPTTATLLLLVLSIIAAVKAVQRWRNQIRDEVYLVGERLHNLGERRPPEGSKTIRR